MSLFQSLIIVFFSYFVFQNPTTIETFPVDTLGPELPRLSIQQNVCVLNQTGYVAGFHSEFKAPVWVHVAVDSQMVWINKYLQ